jgi:hypothetical protein
MLLQNRRFANRRTCVLTKNFLEKLGFIVTQPDNDVFIDMVATKNGISISVKPVSINALSTSEGTYCTSSIQEERRISDTVAYIRNDKVIDIVSMKSHLEDAKKDGGRTVSEWILKDHKETDERFIKANGYNPFVETEVPNVKIAPVSNTFRSTQEPAYAKGEELGDLEVSDIKRIIEISHRSKTSVKMMIKTLDMIYKSKR